jgi:hypothetical protein
MNFLESLKRSTTVVADTGDIEAIAAYRPQAAECRRIRWTCDSQAGEV